MEALPCPPPLGRTSRRLPRASSEFIESVFFFRDKFSSLSPLTREGSISSILDSHHYLKGNFQHAQSPGYPADEEGR